MLRLSLGAAKGMLGRAMAGMSGSRDRQDDQGQVDLAAGDLWHQ